MEDVLNDFVNCSRNVLDEMFLRASSVSSAAILSLRHCAEKKSVEDWENFYDSPILLSEAYVAASNLKQILTMLKENSEVVLDEDDEECLILTTQNLIMINACLTTLDLCQRELNSAHNISLDTH